jgi:hydroxyethylthiazole kinase-like uncharacterized protein yjeF
MKVAFAEEMKRIDRLTQEKFGVSGLILMERAALAVLDAIKARFGDLSGRKVYLCCGKGNNGGDGLALARLLREEAVETTVVLAFDPKLFQGLAAQNYELAVRFGVRIVLWPEVNLTEGDLIVDALLGTGAAGIPSGPLAEIIEAINLSGKPVVAIDLPSGVTVDTGQVNGAAVRAEATVTFGLLKPGLLCYPGAEYAGAVILKQVGFAKPLLEDPQLNLNILSATEIKTLLPKRPLTAHKGTNGHLLVVGGSPGMTGAVVLASQAALRSGSGLVTVGLRPGLPFFEKPLEVLVKPWPELEAELESANFQSIVFGPGLSKLEDGQVFLFQLLERVKVPMVIDADGLNLLAGNTNLDHQFKQSLVFTPHPREMSRLTGLSVSAIQADRIGVARHFASEWKVTIVLKGAHTVIAAPDGQTFINPTGNPGMATAGTGDVLAGMIGGLLAQGLDVMKAAVVGTYLHGLAGDRIALERGTAGMIASDLISAIPIVIKKVQFS